MSEYDVYVKEVNNVFSILEKLKNSWTDNDNFNHIEEINEFKKPIIQGANFLVKQQEEGKKEI